MDEDGFFVGEMNGQLGLVPSNFLEDAPPNPNYPRPMHAPTGGRQGDRERDRRDRSREYGDRDRERDRDRRGSHDPRDSRDSRDPKDRRDPRDRDRSREYGDPRDRGRERGDIRDHRDHRDRDTRDRSREHGDHRGPRSREPSDSRDRSRDHMDHSRDRDRHREYDRDRERDRDRDRHRRVSRERERRDGQTSGPSSAYGAYPSKTTLSNEHRGSNQAGRRMRDEGGPGVGADTPPEHQPSRTTNPPNSIKTEDKDPQVRIPLQRPKGASLSGRKPQPTHSKT